MCFRLAADSISFESIKQQLESTGLQSLWWLQLQDESKAAGRKVSTKLGVAGGEKLAKDLILTSERPRQRCITTKYAKAKREGVKELYAVALDEKSKTDGAVSLAITQLIWLSVFISALSYRCRSSQGEEATLEPPMPEGGSAVPSPRTPPPPLHVRSTADK